MSHWLSNRLRQQKDELIFIAMQAIAISLI